jgi:hypothetical protein
VGGSIRQRRPGVWELRVRTGRDALTGRYPQVSRTFEGTKDEAKTALARLSVQVTDGIHHSTDQTVGYLFDRWIKHLEVLGRTPKTVDGYCSLEATDRQAAEIMGRLPLGRKELTDSDAS